MLLWDIKRLYRNEFIIGVSTLDNIKQKLNYVDQDNDGNGTLERYRKKNFYWYQNVISTNGENL
ncbi:hypothetical protein [Yersinia sp. Marseille-Q3913]|uniref:hypothetical protein n=1 Tax=Yersinia sp. Marseille-Q3913 TaxID=2830769 RepID=UPI002013973E|nr:hypothetical protein [Yersinia sp. Marseille-Q3913]